MTLILFYACFPNALTAHANKPNVRYTNSTTTPTQPAMCLALESIKVMYRYDETILRGKYNINKDKVEMANRRLCGSAFMNKS